MSPEIVDGFRSLTSCELLVEARSGSHRPGRRDSTVADSVEHHLVHDDPRAGWLDIARQDYASLRDAYPVPSRAQVTASGKQAKP